MIFLKRVSLIALIFRTSLQNIQLTWKTVTMMSYALKTLTTLDTCVTKELSIKFRTRMGLLNNHAIVFYWQRLLFLFHDALKCCLKLCSHLQYFSKSWPYNTQFKWFYYPLKHLLVKCKSLQMIQWFTQNIQVFIKYI